MWRYIIAVALVSLWTVRGCFCLRPGKYGLHDRSWDDLHIGCTTGTCCWEQASNSKLVISVTLWFQYICLLFWFSEMPFYICGSIYSICPVSNSSTSGQWRQSKSFLSHWGMWMHWLRLCEMATVLYRMCWWCVTCSSMSHFFFFFCMMYGFPCAQKSRTELFQKVCEVVEWGLKALEKDVAAPLPLDGSAISDSVFMQVWSGRSLTTVGQALHLKTRFPNLHISRICTSCAAKTVYPFVLLERQPRPSIKYQPVCSAINRWTTWFKR